MQQISGFQISAFSTVRMTDHAEANEMVVFFLFNELVDDEDLQLVSYQACFLGQFSLTAAQNRLERIDLAAW
jgi:hypothetical protein